jgi:uncharacterized protein (TIGR02246 family)
MNRFPILLVPLLMYICFVTPSQAQSATPEALVGDFVKAWNSHDGKAFDPLFTDDAIWVPVAEARTEGRSAIVKDFSEIHATWAKTTTVGGQSAMKVQQLRPDVAVVLFHLKFMEGGKEVPGIDRAMVIVAVKEAGGWKIATGQITKQHEGA